MTLLVWVTSIARRSAPTEGELQLARGFSLALLHGKQATSGSEEPRRLKPASKTLGLLPC